MPYNLEYIKIATRASEVSKIMDKEVEKLARKLISLALAKEKTLYEMNYSKRALRNIIDDIHKNIS